MTPDTQTSPDIRERIRHIWSDPLENPAGLLHVCAVASRADGSLGVLRITPDTPASSTDQFSLEVARARSDIILTSGSILRSEPDLRHTVGDAASRWRRDVLRKKDPPEIIFLSRGKAIPLTHPALRQPGATVATGSATPDNCLRQLQERGIRHRKIPGDSPQQLVRELLAGTAKTITLETGPSTAAQFYTGAPRVGELMLSWCHDFELRKSLDAGDFVSMEHLNRAFGPPRHEINIAESAHVWRFSRWVAEA